MTCPHCGRQRRAGAHLAQGRATGGSTVAHTAHRFLKRLAGVTERRPERVTTDLHPAHRKAIHWVGGVVSPQSIPVDGRAATNRARR